VAGPWALRELYRTASGLVRCRRTAAGFAECGSLRQATQQSARRAFEGALNPSGLQASSRSRNATIHKVTSRSQIRSCCTLLRFAWQQSSHYGRDCGGRARGLFSIFQLPSRRASCLGDARGLPIGTDSLSKSAHLGSSNYKRQLCSASRICLKSAKNKASPGAWGQPRQLQKMRCGRQRTRPLSRCIGGPNSKPPLVVADRVTADPDIRVTSSRGLSRLTTYISFQRRHARDSVQPISLFLVF
jgi:hypothetical protein